MLFLCIKFYCFLLTIVSKYIKNNYNLFFCIGSYLKILIEIKYELRVKTDI